MKPNAHCPRGSGAALALLCLALFLGGAREGIAGVRQPAEEGVKASAVRKAVPVAKKTRVKAKVKAKASKPAAPVAPELVLMAAPVLGVAPAPVVEPVPHAAAQAGVQPPTAPSYAPRVNPYLVNAVAMEGASLTASLTASPAPVPASRSASGFGLSLPHVPLFEQAILPKIQTVYPTGEKPLVVVTFKCPTELVGIDTPSTVILHKAINGGMDLINKSNLLAFNMQQVCQ